MDAAALALAGLEVTCRAGCANRRPLLGKRSRRARCALGGKHFALIRAAARERAREALGTALFCVRLVPMHSDLMHHKVSAHAPRLAERRAQRTLRIVGEYSQVARGFGARQRSRAGNAELCGGFLGRKDETKLLIRRKLEGWRKPAGVLPVWRKGDRPIPSERDLRALPHVRSNTFVRFSVLQEINGVEKLAEAVERADDLGVHASVRALPRVHAMYGANHSRVWVSACDT